MLLNSPLFVFLFLPIAIAGFFLCGRVGGARVALGWICVVSLVFYLHWNPAHAWVLALTLGWNYLIAQYLIRPDTRWKRAMLVTGVSGNAAFLAGFKVIAGGIWDNAGGFSTSTHILIPLAISFITFQQIAFIVDVYKRRIKTINPLDYLAFILFFPQLVMGPIVHYRDMHPQFHHHDWTRWQASNVSIGTCLFIIGLFKKLVIADSIAPYVNEGFASPDTLTPWDMWAVVMGFQMQLYFDFSGYADMAIGIARILNIRLPINFDAPYRAVNRFDQWRRWHISFSAFMRQYVFFPLAKNRKFPLNATQALFVVAVLSGFWHGFGITFMLWGLAQAVLMLLTHWRKKWQQRLTSPIKDLQAPAGIQVLITFGITLMLGVLFRSPDMATATTVYQSLFTPGESASFMTSLFAGPLGMYLAIAALVTWCLPTTQQVFAHHWTAMDQRHEQPQDTWPGLIPASNRLRFTPNLPWAVLMGLMLACCITFMDRSSRFIYYQF
ncbi:MAG: MBOAT family protein [Gammaproteobacteria bacterium]|nr:MAG: MBOAT family protein [Gammaproteobacteria bacterium]